MGARGVVFNTPGCQIRFRQPGRYSMLNTSGVALIAFLLKRFHFVIEKENVFEIDLMPDGAEGFRVTNAV